MRKKAIGITIVFLSAIWMGCVFGEEISVDVLINKLNSDDKMAVKEAKKELRALGNKALGSLRKAASSKDRKLRVEIISTYGEIILEQNKNMAEDKLLIDSLNDEYYLARILALGVLAKGGHTDIVEKASQKIKEPAEDDSRIFNDIIVEMRKKVDIKSKVMNPTMLEEGYLIAMDNKISQKLEAIIFNENEQVNLRMRLIPVYCQINDGECSNTLIKILDETNLLEIKEAALAGLRNRKKQNDTLLVRNLQELLAKEKNFEIRQMYKSIISYLADSNKEN